jgi:autotransporter strand-loop-strand O-heptosyltransferase
VILLPFAGSPGDAWFEPSGAYVTESTTTSAAASASAEPSAAAQDNKQEKPKRAFPAPADHPTQTGERGIRFDFNDGCRVALPEKGGPWKVRISDLDTGNIVFETELVTGRINSVKRYYIRFRIEAWVGTDKVFQHDFSAAGREVLVQFPVGTLGDTMGWFPYAVKFQRKHGCKLTCAMAEWLIPLYADAYPEIEFVSHEGVKPERYYATYGVGLFFDDDARVFQPCDFRLVGLHRTAGYILGVDPTEEPPKIVIPDDRRPIPERYVAIAAQSTTQAKYWNNPNGWREIVAYLKENGYRVICIDKKPTHGAGLVWNHIPFGAEDETGDRPLTERARWLKHADFFIGLTSGLSWLAWAAGTKVVMIAGFTHPLNEFHTPWRIINYHACNGCWNDVRVRFDHKEFLWCPRHKDTPRQFECTRLITVDHVKQVLRTIPGFGEGAATAPRAARPAQLTIAATQR